MFSTLCKYNVFFCVVRSCDVVLFGVPHSHSYIARHVKLIDYKLFSDHWIGDWRIVYRHYDGHDCLWKYSFFLQCSLFLLFFLLFHPSLSVPFTFSPHFFFSLASNVIIPSNLIDCVSIWIDIIFNRCSYKWSSSSRFMICVCVATYSHNVNELHITSSGAWLALGMNIN